MIASRDGIGAAEQQRSAGRQQRFTEQRASIPDMDAWRYIFWNVTVPPPPGVLLPLVVAALLPLAAGAGAGAPAAGVVPAPAPAAGTLTDASPVESWGADAAVARPSSAAAAAQQATHKAGREADIVKPLVLHGLQHQNADIRGQECHVLVIQRQHASRWWARPVLRSSSAATQHGTMQRARTWGRGGGRGSTAAQPPKAGTRVAAAERLPAGAAGIG